MNCPSCQSVNIKKNGHIAYNGKQNYKCKKCGKQFVSNCEKKLINEEYKNIINNIIKKLLLERISLRGICRVMNVSLTWLLDFFRETTGKTSDDMGIVKPEKSKLVIEIDEMWSFVGKKEIKKWIWLAIDRISGQIVGFHIGERTEKDAKKLWKSLPGVYRQCAVCYTDF